MRQDRWKERRRKSKRSSSSKRVSSQLGNAFNLVIRIIRIIPARKSNHRFRMLVIFSPILFFIIRKSTPTNWKTFLQHRPQQRTNPSIVSTIIIMWSTMIIVILVVNCMGRWFHVIRARQRFICFVLIHHYREKMSRKGPTSARTVERKQQKKTNNWKQSVNRSSPCRSIQNFMSTWMDSRNTQRVIQPSSRSNYRQVIDRSLEFRGDRDKVLSRFSTEWSIAGSTIGRNQISCHSQYDQNEKCFFKSQTETQRFVCVSAVDDKISSCSSGENSQHTDRRLASSAPLVSTGRISWTSITVRWSSL